MGFKLWISNPGALKHIENLGGCTVKQDDNIYEVFNLPASKLRDIRGIFVMSHPRTQFERAYLDAVVDRYKR